MSFPTAAEATQRPAASQQITRRGAFSAMIFSSALATLESCGYNVGGQAVTIPKGIQTIAIPAFTTLSTRYRLIDLLPQEVGREFNTRSRFRVITDSSTADAVLRGNINSATAGASVYDPFSGKATVVGVVVVVSLTMSERTTGRLLFSRPSLAFRQNYNIAADPHQYFDESGPAFDRVSRDLARDIVSAVLEDF